MPSVLEVLDNESDRILERALEELVRSNEVHYADLGPELARQRLADLLALVNSSIAQRDLVPMIEYSTTVADERFDAGFDIREVQRAFHVLEEAIWERVVDTVEPSDLAEAIGLVGTVLGAGRDALAREYVSRASKQHVTSLDLGALFRGGH